MTLSENDAVEVERFAEYLKDLYSDMTPEVFADKWAEYIGVMASVARNYKAKFGSAELPGPLPAKLPGIPGVTVPFKDV